MAKKNLPKDGRFIRIQRVKPYQPRGGYGNNKRCGITYSLSLFCAKLRNYFKKQTNWLKKVPLQ